MINPGKEFSNTALCVLPVADQKYSGVTPLFKQSSPCYHGNYIISFPCLFQQLL